MQNHETWVKRIALLLCVCVLGGCAARDTASASDIALSESALSGLEEPGLVQTETMPVEGAYVEECMSDSLPETYQFFSDLHIEADGAVSVTGMDRSGTLRLLRYQSGTWQASAAFSLEEQGSRQAGGICSISEDGALWYTEYHEEGSALFRLEKGKDAQRIPVNCLDTAGSIPLSLRTDADGMLLLNAQQGERTTLAVIDTKTCAVQEIAPGFYAKPVFYETGKLYAMPVGSQTLYTWDVQTGQDLERVELFLQDDVSQYPCALCGGMFSYADERGLHAVALGGSLRQDLAKNRSFALARESFIKNDLAVDSDSVYWVTGTEKGEAKLYCYRYDPTFIPNDAQTLKIWTMEDCLLLREAVSTFLSENTDVEIEIEYGSDSLSGGMMEEDIIRALNVRLAAGDGPDVLILDGLPVTSYLAQGLLTDMDGRINLAGCYEKIVNSYRTDSGLGAVPMLFRPALIWCREDSEAEILRSARSLSDLRSILCDRDKYFFGGYYNVFSELYPAASADIFPTGGGDVNEAALRDFLTLTQEIAEKQGITEETDALFGKGEDTVQSMGMGRLGVDTPASMSRYGREESNCAGGMPSDYNSTYISAVAVAEKLPAAICPLPGNVFEPVMTVGVPVTSQKQELAVRWIQCLLDCENETECNFGGMFHGFFVKEGLQQSCLDLKYQSRELPLPSELDLDGLCRQLTKMANTDSFLRSAVYEEAQKFYQGKQDMNSTVNAILMRIRLYEAERQ